MTSTPTHETSEEYLLKVGLSTPVKQTPLQQDPSWAKNMNQHKTKLIFDLSQKTVEQEQMEEEIAILEHQVEGLQDNLDKLDSTLKANQEERKKPSLISGIAEQFIGVSREEIDQVLNDVPNTYDEQIKIVQSYYMNESDSYAHLKRTSSNLSDKIHSFLWVSNDVSVRLQLLKFWAKHQQLQDYPDWREIVSQFQFLDEFMSTIPYPKVQNNGKYLRKVFINKINAEFKKIASKGAKTNKS